MVDVTAPRVFDGPRAEIPRQLQDTVQGGVLVPLLAQNHVRGVPMMMAAEPCHSRLEKTAARKASAQNAGRMSDLLAKASGGRVPETLSDGTSMLRAARASDRMSGDMRVIGRWALKRWAKGLPL